MRFLIGIITGTVLTLFIATALDAPTHPTLDRAGKAVFELWDTVINRTSNALFEPSADTVDDGRSVGSGTTRLALAEPVEEKATEPPVTGAPFRAAEPATALAPPEELPPPPPVRVDVAARSPAAEADSGDALPADGSLPAWQEPESREAALFAPSDTEASERAGVWTPFHSQRSAEGFAARLSRELDHDFRVERRGAGAYQVVVDVTSPAERTALLTEIAEITGQ